MLKRSLLFVILIGFAITLSGLFLNYSGSDELSRTAKHYAENGVAEVGAANLVTSVVVTYRGLDTLGEVSILFLTAAIISMFLKVSGKRDERKVRKTSEILNTAVHVLLPVVFLFGTYIFVNGHLTPGGGFQGGAVIASGVLMIFLADPSKKINHSLIHTVESISGLSFVILGILGIVLAGGFLDNSIIGLGEFGTLFSAGAIPIIYTFVGLKVGAELSNILNYYNDNLNEA